jgi:GntR family transcriptional regulator/MocR family aminotransferase
MQETIKSSLPETEETGLSGSTKTSLSGSTDTNKRSLAYIKLYQYLRQQIISGVYPYGSKIPSKRLLAADQGVSVITVQHALALLEDEGFLLAKERSGYYVSYKASEFLTSEGFPGSTDHAKKRLNKLTIHSNARILTNFESEPQVSTSANFESESQASTSANFESEPQASTPAYFESEEEFPFPTYARTVRRVLSEMQEKIFKKSENQGTMELRSCLARYLERTRNMHVSPDQIVIGSGAEYLYGLISILIGPGQTIALEDPSYQKIRWVYETHGLQIEPLRMGADGILTSELQRSHAKAMHVTPFHSYPTEISATVSKKMEYLSWARESHALLIEDDYDSEFSMLGKSEDTLFSMEPTKTVIYLNTFTRTISPSVRIGYMILPEFKTKEFLDRIGLYSCTVPVLDQYVLTDLIEEGDFERHLNRVRRKRRRGRI